MATNAGERKSVRELVEALRQGKLSRRELVVGLTALGLTGAGIAAVVAAATHTGAAATPQHIQLQQHDQHVTQQTQGDVSGHMADYAEHAIVDDPLFAQPFAGIHAITQRFVAEVASVPDRSLRILNRVVSGNQLIVEWEAAGTHAASFLGIGGSGRAYRITGVTVVTREQGKIVRESHYYDTVALRQQIDVV
jgi:steroid delta-isomerase-like uncharacterized protein